MDCLSTLIVLSFHFYFHIIAIFLVKIIFVSQVKLGEPGYTERYYTEKFQVSLPEEIDRVKKDLVSSLMCCQFSEHYLAVNINY